MRSRTDIIAAVLRRPTFRRPVVGHELRGAQVQLLGRNSDLTWTATVPQLAEAIDTALLKNEEKDTPTGNQPAGAASTARDQILTHLQTTGLTAEAARKLLARADREPHTGDAEYQATLGGGHALVVEYGDEEIYGTCQCGKPLGILRPSQPLERFAGPWERHVMTEVS